MLKNFFTVAWRNLVRNKLHSAINITGLSIGVSACLVIFLIVTHELSFNKEFQGYDRIYRIHSSFKGVFSGLNRGIPTAVAPAIKEQFKGVESVAQFHIFGSKVIIPTAKEKKELNPGAIIITEPSFFDVFANYEWIAGSPASLSEPFKVVLTESSASTYFGTTNPDDVVGKEIIYRDSLRTTVAGIVKDLTFNTDIDFKDFISYSTIEKSWVNKKIRLDDWTSVSSSSQLFIKLDPGTSVNQISEQTSILKKLYKEHSEWDVENEFTLQPLTDLHYNANTGIFDHSNTEPAHLPTLVSLAIIAILLLIIGSINFINLETAQAFRRAKEVGVRKVMGSTQRRLVLQFLAERFIVTLAAVVLALPISEFVLNFFKEFVPAGVTMDLFQLAPILLILTVIVGFLAGLYPAFVLSSYLPALVLKNQAYSSTRTSGATFLRKSLIVFQFTFAQALIIATLIVGWQIRFLLNKDLGFKKDAIVYFYSDWQEKPEKARVLKNELEKIPGISKISMSDDAPSSNGWSSSTISYKGKEEIKASVYLKFGDINYVDFYGIKLLGGRNIQSSDTVKEILINETLMKHLGFSNPHDAIGQLVEYDKKQIPIVGVVSDFHIQSLHKKVEPVMIADRSSDFTCFNIQLSGDATYGKETLAKVEAAWTQVYPNTKVNFQFLDETIRNFYRTEERTAKLVKTAMALAIFISCLGLFGLASYTSVQRTKEIGIRKVLGATSRSIVMLLSKDFIFLVLLAFILAAPLAWFAGTRWLEGYAYQVEMQAWLFIVTAICAILIAFVTVSYQTVKAANSNPVNSLRNE